MSEEAPDLNHPPVQDAARLPAPAIDLYGSIKQAEGDLAGLFGSIKSTIQDFFTGMGGGSEEEATEEPPLAPDLPQGAAPTVTDLPFGASRTQLPVEAGLRGGFPIGASPPPEKGIVEKILGRFAGTDVKDPMEFTRLGSIIAGTVAGGIKGSQVPGPVFVKVITTAAGSAIGALGGAIAPEATMELGEKLGVLEKGYRLKHGLSPEDLKTVAEGEVLLDLATSGGFTVLRATGRATGRVLTGVDKRAIALAEQAAKQGAHLMPVQVGNRAIGRGYVTILGKFPWIASSIVKRARSAEKALETSIRNAPSRIAPILAQSEVSRLIYEDAKILLKNTTDIYGKEYENVFKLGDEYGVAVVPKGVLAKGDEILKKIGAETPVNAAGEPTSAGKALDSVRKFITDEIHVMREVGETSTMTARQSLRQMDGLISKIDQEIAALEPSQRKFARSLYIQLVQAAKSDVLVNATGKNAEEIAKRLKTLDTGFSHIMSEIFETATAKRFASVERRGLKGAKFDEATRTPIDQLARIVTKLDSPQAIEELSRIVSGNTFKRIAAQVVDSAVIKSIVKQEDGMFRFDADMFAKTLGLGDDYAKSNQRLTVNKMLELSGSPVKIKDLDALVESARQIATLDIPNVSAFVARRATLGGWQAAMNAFIPGAAVLGGSFWAGGTLLAAATFLGGGKLVSAILSNPNTARQLSKVLDKEVSHVIKRKAYLEILRGGVFYMREQAKTLGESGETPFLDANMDDIIPMFLDGLKNTYDQLRTEGAE